MEGRSTSRWRRGLEGGLFAVAAVLLGYWITTQVGGRVTKVIGMRELAAAQQANAAAPETAPRVQVTENGFVGRIEISRLGLDAVILEGTNDTSLLLGVGHMSGTALPGEQGNVVLAGHRDTFFRPLKDARPGDVVRISTASDDFEYRVVSTNIVDPDEVELIANAGEPTLTLITCYPFHYVGAAPRRFVVRALPVGSRAESVVAPTWATMPLADRAAVVRALVAHGARIDHKGADGQTVTERARRSGQPALVAALNTAGK